MATNSTVRMVAPGTPVDLMTEAEAIDLIVGRATEHDGPPLAVNSVNLDHIHHARTGAYDAHRRRAAVGPVEWVSLADGMPIVKVANKLTGSSWPRLTGSDLLIDVLDAAAREGFSVGFLGGRDEVHELLRRRLERDWPGVRIAGTWSPSRDDILADDRSASVAEQIRAAGTDVLVVGLGKPRQEQWIVGHGLETGARVLLAFGGAADFLAGATRRAPRWVGDAGLEWAWRLVHEPRRLFRRYVLQGPPALLALVRESRLEDIDDAVHEATTPFLAS